MELFDSHTHYNDEQFDEDRKEILQKVRQLGVSKLVVPGYSVDSSKKAIQIANSYDFVYATCGISPNDIKATKEEIDAQIEAIRKIVQQDNKVVAIGEIGLDYYWKKENRKLQKYAFREQIKLANDNNLSIVIHTREAVMDTLDILKNQVKAKLPGVFHCCPLNRELIKEALKLDFYISFAGPITFKNSKNAKEVIKLVPFENMLIETDSPYLSPEPKRGRRNDSSYVIYIAEKIAEFKKVPVEKIAECTYQNAKTVFQIK